MSESILETKRLRRSTRVLLSNTRAAFPEDLRSRDKFLNDSIVPNFNDEGLPGCTESSYFPDKEKRIL